MMYLQPTIISPPLSDRLSLLWLRATLVACADGPLPRAFGTTLHSALGRALKSTVCVYPDPFAWGCATCRLLDQCSYPRLFEPQDRPHNGSVPPPALLVAPSQSTPSRVSLGSTLQLELVLVGRAIHALPLLLVSLAKMAEAGFGSQRVPFAVVRVDYLDPQGQPAAPIQIGERVNAELLAPLPLAVWLEGSTNSPLVDGIVRIQVVSRMRLQRDGRILRRPPEFIDFVRAVVRRADALAQAHGGEVARFPDPRDWLTAATAVKLVGARLGWQIHERRSASTGQTMPLDGFVGTLKYAAPPATLAAFMPVLRLGQALGAGRGCSFGNGRYRLVAVTEP